MHIMRIMLLHYLPPLDPWISPKMGASESFPVLFFTGMFPMPPFWVISWGTPYLAPVPMLPIMHNMGEDGVKEGNYPHVFPFTFIPMIPFLSMMHIISRRGE